MSKAVLADAGLKLLQSLHVHSTFEISQYQTDLVRQVQREMKTLYQEAYQYNAMPKELQSQEQASTVTLLSTILYRNKRLLLTYHHHRLLKIKQLCWKYAYSHPLQIPESVQSQLSPDEQIFYKKYAKLIHSYRGTVLEFGELGMLQPPKSTFVLVRAKKPLRVETEDGSVIDLKEGWSGNLRLSTVQSFIQMGHLVIENQ